MELTKQLAEHQAIRGSVSTVVVLRQMVTALVLVSTETADMWLSDQCSNLVDNDANGRGDIFVHD